MLNVGLTGNVASGKSTVASHFASWGATVLDADQLVRDVQTPGTPTYAAIIDAFGTDVLQPDDTLDRTWLRRRILYDDAARSRLNGIVHPAVGKRRARLAADAAARGDAILVNDIPLLFEVLDPEQFDLIVLVDAPTETRRRRLLEHRGLGPDDADRLMATQQPSATKREKSHIVVDNAGSLPALERSAHKAWREVRYRAARASDAGRGPLVVVVAHGDDVLATMRGTMERYADAGVEMCVVSATSTPSLGIPGEIVTLGRASGGLDPEDANAIDRVTRAITEIQPSTVVTFGPDGLNRDADHCAVHVWTRHALLRVPVPPQLVYVAAPPDPDPSGGESSVFGVDVRPWLPPDRSRHVTTVTPCGLEPRSSGATTDMPGREWYRAAVAGEHPATGLFHLR